MAEASFKSGGTLRMTGSGTLVGMPAIQRGFDALHPERWSHPPPPGTAPIVPCDEESEACSSSLPAVLRARPAQPDATPLPRLPMRRVMPEEERRLLARSAIAGILSVVVVLCAAIARLLLL